MINSFTEKSNVTQKFSSTLLSLMVIIGKNFAFGDTKILNKITISFIVVSIRVLLLAHYMLAGIP